jgi:uncharacterized repeat protein (TIGR01451 family)
MRVVQAIAALSIYIRRLARLFVLLSVTLMLVESSPAGPAFFVTNAIPVPDDVSPMTGNEIDPAIVVCPVTTSNLSSSNLFVAGFSDALSGIFTAYTTNQGLTWATNVIATNSGSGFDSNGLIAALGEPTVAWDTYGNLFLAYIPYLGDGVAVCVSTNGGRTFSTLTNLVPGDATDQPRLTSPALGAGAGSLWLTYKNYSVSRAPVVAQGLKSAGLGTNGAFGLSQTIPGSTNNGGFADVAVGPAGQVMVAYQTSANLPGPASIYVSVNTNAFGGGVFAPAVAVTTDTIGGYTYINAEDTGIGVNGAVGLAWDDNPYSSFYNQAYLVYTATGSGGNLIIATRSSPDGGHTWGAESQVNDDASGNDHFFPRVAVDPTTGVLAYSWMDCRNDLGSASAIITYGATTNYTFTNFVVTQVKVISVAKPANNSFTYIATDLSGGNGTNYSVVVTGNNFYGMLLGSNSAPGTHVTNIVSIYNSTNANGTNLEIMFIGTNTAATTNTDVAIDFVDNFPNAYTEGGTGNEEAEPYMTISTNGGAAFLPNQSIVPTPGSIPFPAVGVASDVNRSTGLLGYGHYTGMAFYGGNFYPAWPDNSDITGTDPDGNTNFDLSVAEVVVPTADISATVTWAPNPVVSGSAVEFFLVVSNNGPFPAPNFSVTDVLPPNVAYENATPAHGGVLRVNGQTLTFTWPNTPTLAAHGSLTNFIFCQATSSSFATNVATVTAALPDTVPTNNTVTNVIFIDGEDLAVGLTASPLNVNVSNTVTFTVSVTNFGPASDGFVYVTNTLPTSLSAVTNVFQTQGTYFFTNNDIVFAVGTMATNQVVTITYQAYALSLGVKFQTAMVNATVSSLDVDTNLVNNSVFATVNILGEDLAAGLSASTASANVGDTIIYTLSITNFGPSSSGDVTFTNILPSNVGQVQMLQFPPSGSGSLIGNVLLFDVGEILAGQVVTVKYSAVALSLGAGATNALNTVTVASTVFDTSSVNNTASITTTINGEDLAVGGLVNPTLAPTNQLLTYTVVVTNLGPAATGVIMVTNVLATNLSALTILQAPGSFILSGNALVFNAGTLAAGQTATMVFTAIPTSLGAASDAVFAGSTVFDTNLVNNAELLSSSIVAPPALVTNFTVSAFASSAAFSWVTPFSATVQVAYGLTTNLGALTTLSGPSTNHLIVLAGLQRDTNYYYSAMTWENGIYYATNGSFQTVDTIILNTQDASYSNFWAEGSPATPGIFGTYFNDTEVSPFNVTATATYDPMIPTPGLYNVYVWYPQATNFTTNAPLVVYGATNAVSQNLNETRNGGAWLQLATNLYFAQGTAGQAILYNQTGETNKLVAANAMKWSYVDSQDYPTNGTVPAWWASLYFGTNQAAANAYYADYVLGVPPGTPTAGALAFSYSPGPSHTTTFTFSPFVGGRLYQLMSATNLYQPNWSPMTVQPAFDSGGNGFGVFAITNPAAAQTYLRLSVQLGTNY